MEEKKVLFAGIGWITEGLKSLGSVTDTFCMSLSRFALVAHDLSSKKKKKKQSRKKLNVWNRTRTVMMKNDDGTTLTGIKRWAEAEKGTE